MVTTTSITAVSVSMRSAQSLQRAGVDAAQRARSAPMAFDADLVEGDPGEQRGDEQQARGDEFAGARADHAAEQAGKMAAEERQEDDR